MSWIENLATSEFAWGIVIGILLSMLAAWCQGRFQLTDRRRAVVTFCSDSIASICETIKNIDDHRDLNKRIVPEFIGLLEAEIGIFGRNREHLIAIHDAPLRREVRDFVNRAAQHTAQVRSHLNNFYELNKMKDALAETALGEANKACAKLMELQQRRDPLEARLRAEHHKRFWQ